MSQSNRSYAKRDAATETRPCPKCGQRVYEFALPTPCPSCGGHILRAEHIFQRAMATSFVVARAYHAIVNDWDGMWSGADRYECDHAHETVEEAIACGDAWIAEHKGNSNDR